MCRRDVPPPLTPSGNTQRFFYQPRILINQTIHPQPVSLRTWTSPRMGKSTKSADKRPTQQLTLGGFFQPNPPVRRCSVDYR